MPPASPQPATTAPRVRSVTWLGGRTYTIEDLREMPGAIAFYVTDEARINRMRIRKGTDLEAEVAQLLEGT
jgi:hypothetical protein